MRQPSDKVMEWATTAGMPAPLTGMRNVAHGGARKTHRKKDKKHKKQKKQKKDKKHKNKTKKDKRSKRSKRTKKQRKYFRHTKIQFRFLKN
jgi:flagellar biosynthesis component FlhA